MVPDESNKDTTNEVTDIPHGLLLPKHMAENGSLECTMPMETGNTEIFIPIHSKRNIQIDLETNFYNIRIDFHLDKSDVMQKDVDDNQKHQNTLIYGEHQGEEVPALDLNAAGTEVVIDSNDVIHSEPILIDLTEETAAVADDTSSEGTKIPSTM